MNDPAQPWLDSARRSLAAAEALFDAGLWPNACFEAQQCVELILKAAIIHSGSLPPRVHGLVELAGHLAPELREHVQDVLPAFHDLNTYYSSTRYPDAMVGELPEREEAQVAVAVARRVVQAVRQTLS
ncbi:MAG TPA: HEPN domain-containing protein [Chloroflexota bacterium]|nr:HEPN domain-containing protein [Chloroflexota bacterium]